MPPLPRLALIAPVLLAACMQTAPNADRPDRSARANDGMAAKLFPGSTQAEVEAQLGFDAGFERNPADFDESCVSYPYGDGTRHVHAVFRAGRLVRASDGHESLCTYGTLVAPEPG